MLLLLMPLVVMLMLMLPLITDANYDATDIHHGTFDKYSREPYHTKQLLFLHYLSRPAPETV